jgi:hypothetical protein
MAAAGFDAQLAGAVRSAVPGNYRRIRDGGELVCEPLDAQDRGLRPYGIGVAGRR